jgi:hypothetical protein
MLLIGGSLMAETYSRRLFGINAAKEMRRKLKELSLSMLEELRHLPRASH